MGNNTGSDLGVNLYEVKRAAHMLQGMGDGYKSLTNKVDGTDSADDAAFAEHETRTGGQASAVLAAWAGLRDEFQAILGTTQRNLYDTSIALDRCINEYCEQDHEAAVKFREEAKNSNATNGIPVPKENDWTPIDVPKYDEPKMPEGY